MLQLSPTTSSKPATQIALIAIASLLLAAGCAPKAQPTQVQKKGYTFWPPEPDEPRIQYLTTINSSKDLSEAQKGGFEQMVYGNEPEHVVAVQKPYGVRYWNGRLYVTEIRVGAVTVLDLAKQQTRIMGATGSGAIKKAVDMAIAPDGTKYVVDQGDSSIKIFSAAERFVTKYALPDTQLNGICIFGPYLYVTDFRNKRVMILDRNYGKVLKTFGTHGALDGEFIGPLAIAPDSRGCVYVTDVILARVQKFGPDGSFMMKFGGHGEGPGFFRFPKHVGVGRDGHIHVVDSLFANVQVFDPEGKFVGFYGSPGSHRGALDQPAGLEMVETHTELFQKYVHPAFEAERIIVVSNQFGSQKLNVYAMGKLKAGMTVADLRGREKLDVALAATTQPAATMPAGVAAAPTPPPATRPSSDFATRP